MSTAVNKRTWKASATATTSSPVAEKVGKKTKDTEGSKAGGTKDKKGKTRISTFQLKSLVLEHMLTGFVTG